MTGTSFAFDTLATARKLKAAGVAPAHAEAQAEAIAAAARTGRGDLATRADLASLETRLVKLVFAVAGGQVAIIVALLKLLE